jgi:hypothetical protein
VRKRLVNKAHHHTQSRIAAISRLGEASNPGRYTSCQSSKKCRRYRGSYRLLYALYQVLTHLATKIPTLRAFAFQANSTSKKELTVFADIWIYKLLVQYNRVFVSFCKNIVPLHQYITLKDMVMDTLERQTTGRMYGKIHRLPPKVQQELSDYIEYLLWKYQAEELKKPFFGCMQGTVTWMSDDFNAPLDDFKEYM